MQEEAAPILTPQEMVKVKEVFQKYDDNDNQLLGRSELRAVMSDIIYENKKTFSEDCTKRLMRRFCEKKKTIRGKRKEKILLNFQDFIRCYEYVKKMVQSYLAFDTNKNGKLELGECINALSYYGLKFLGKETVTLLFKKFRREHPKSLTIDEYIELVIFLNEIVLLFRSRKPQKGVIVLDLKDFITVLSTL